MDNLTAGNPLAHRVRVYYEGSNTIYQGMLLNYNHDTTTNWFGGSVSAGAVTASTTTAEGSQNEGKYIRVEEPSEANKRFTAGVVCPGGWNGKTGPRVLDIYVPNGAIVPVRSSCSSTINDKAYGITGANTITNTAGRVTDVPCIGVFVETIDRTTPGLAFVKLSQPNLAEVEDATTLGIGLSPLLWADAPKSAAGRPGAGVDYFNDFMDGAASGVEGWVVTQSNSTGVIESEADAPGGVLEVDSLGALADDSVNCQLPSCAVLPQAGVNIWFEARIKIEQDEQQWFFGLAGADTTLMASGAVDDVVGKVGFYHGEADTDLVASTITARTTVDDATADIVDPITDDTWLTLGFKITGLTSVEFYHNGVLIETGTTTTCIPNVGIALSAFAGYESAHQTISIDWVKLVSSGGRDA